MRLIALGALPILVGLALSGCVSVREPTVIQAHYRVEPSPARQSRLTHVKSWDIQGALSVQYQHHADLASYRWLQHEDGQYHLKIASSLNLYTLTLSKDHHRIRLQRSGQKKAVSGQSPEALLQKSLGWHIPVSPLSYWIRGLPAPGKVEKIAFDRYGHLAFVNQQGWSVSFSHYLSNDKNDFPYRLDLVGYSMKIRVVVKSGSW